jgi:hypothetical protein
MARFLGFVTALAATGAFALTPECVQAFNRISMHPLT